MTVDFLTFFLFSQPQTNTECKGSVIQLVLWRPDKHVLASTPRIAPSSKDPFL